MTDGKTGCIISVIRGNHTPVKRHENSSRLLHKPKSFIFPFHRYKTLCNAKDGLLFLLLFFNLPVAAQQQPISNQQVFKTEDGLPQSFVSGIAEDKDGFIWIGTQDGIARYDGRSFKTISKKETGGIGFRSHVITNMAYNENNHITILYQGSNIDDFDPVTFAIKPVSGGKKKTSTGKTGSCKK
jgi:hypothetical protein